MVLSGSLHRCGHLAILFVGVDALSLTSPVAHLDDRQPEVTTRLRRRRPGLPTNSLETAGRHLDAVDDLNVEAPPEAAASVSSDAASEHDVLLVKRLKEDQDKYYFTVTPQFIFHVLIPTAFMLLAFIMINSGTVMG